METVTTVSDGASDVLSPATDAEDSPTPAAVIDDEETWYVSVVVVPALGDVVSVIPVLGHGVDTLVRVSGSGAGRGHKVDSLACEPDAVPDREVVSPAFGPGPGTRVTEGKPEVDEADELAEPVTGSSLCVKDDVVVPDAGLGHKVDSLACAAIADEVDETAESTSGSSLEMPLVVDELDCSTVGLGHKVVSLACEADAAVAVPRREDCDEAVEPTSGSPVERPLVMDELELRDVGLGHRVDSLACEAGVDIAETRREDQPDSDETEEPTLGASLERPVVAGELYRRDVGLGHEVDSPACEAVTDEGVSEADELNVSERRRVDQRLESPGKPEDGSEVDHSVLARDESVAADATEDEVRVALAEDVGAA
ncbi:hypothetical protein XA68_13629 [Ophiocordyceps unilateralis]|uniref:Uncharacterized protein n=1 Tax=Ophiocordyceps unilateralis TaxID=268505 RepID=A0A2A9PBT6_OPHUN|nr:hypothetical protein XA68_13629 [Ophiocordyceps unilateralis]